MKKCHTRLNSGVIRPHLTYGWAGPGMWLSLCLQPSGHQHHLSHVLSFILQYPSTLSNLFFTEKGGKSTAGPSSLCIVCQIS